MLSNEVFWPPPQVKLHKRHYKPCMRKFSLGEFSESLQEMTDSFWVSQVVNDIFKAMVKDRLFSKFKVILLVLCWMTLFCIVSGCWSFNRWYWCDWYLSYINAFAPSSVPAHCGVYLLSFAVIPGSALSSMALIRDQAQTLWLTGTPRLRGGSVDQALCVSHKSTLVFRFVGSFCSFY